MTDSLRDNIIQALNQMSYIWNDIHTTSVSWLLLEKLLVSNFVDYVRTIVVIDDDEVRRWYIFIFRRVEDIQSK